jgi:hypothetical protein
VILGSITALRWPFKATKVPSSLMPIRRE